MTQTHTTKGRIQKIITFLICSFLLFNGQLLFSQTSDFDGTDGLTLTLSGGSLMSGATGLFPSGSVWGNTGNAYVISNNTGIITTTAQTIANTSSFSFDLQSISGTSGNGVDGSDDILVEVSTDNGTNFTTIVTINGNSNARWTYAGGNSLSTDYSTPVTIAPGGGGDRDDDMDGIESVTITNIPAGDIVVRITADNNSGSENWVIDNLVLLDAAACQINGVATANEMCSGADFTFEVSFTPVNASGTYEVIDATNGNAILATGSTSPISVTIPNNGSTTPFDVNVWDQGDNTCLGTAVSVTPLNCVICEISNVSVSNGLCLGPDYTFDVSFTELNSSGAFEVIDVTNGNTVLGSGATSPITITLSNNTSTTTFEVNVRDENDVACLAGSTATVSPEICAQNGINCWDINGNGINDPAEDTNGDTFFDALDCQGADGMDGVDGMDGAVGPQGPAGMDGADGMDGAVGPQGPAGPAGMDGAVGPQGPAGPAGMDGVDGMDGAVGPQGPAGPAGMDGVDGMDGAVGPQGPAGPAGMDGVDGTEGPEGPQGPAGPQGIQGIQGEIGPQGPTGPAGMDGVDGMDGAQGPQGPQGEMGPQGSAGPQGPQGLQGPAGMDGAEGPEGPQGPTGPAGMDGVDGMDGAVGPQGPAGPQGIQGIQGEIGPQGPTGPAGMDGVDGMDGAVGPQGPAGMDGVDGMDGAVGPQGPAGPAGMDGVDGAEGPEGPQGPAGPQGIQGIQGEIGPQGPAGDPATADGNGIYSGDGTTMANTTVTISDILNFDGDIAISGQVFGLSDERLKTNIAPLINALSLLAQLNPTTYNFDIEEFEKLNLPNEKQYGLLAQSVEKVIPEIVTTTHFNGNQEFKSINYNALISILVGAINEQQEKIDAIENKLNDFIKKQELINQK